MDPALKPAIVTAGATALAAVIAALMIMYQIARQGRNAIEQNKRNEAMKLRLKIYEEFSAPAEAMMRAEGAFSSYVRNFVTELELRRVIEATNPNPPTPRARLATMRERRETFVQTVIDLMIAIERWEIIDAKLDLFRLGLSVGLHDLHDAITPHSKLALRYMPVPRSDAARDGETLPWTTPSEAEIAEVKSASEALVNAAMVLNDYGSDFLIAIQNMLIGELFNTTRKPRTPLDPKRFALRLDRYPALKKHFETETAWGRDMQKAEKRVLDEVARTRANKPRWRRMLDWLPFMKKV
jgi:hypothetical protein